MGLFLSGFIAFLAIGVPIALALGLACALYLLLTGNADLLRAFPQHMISGVDNFILLTIPMFLLAGNLMNAGGITTRLVDCARAVVGHVRGGLALVNVVASMFFSGISGAATADASALGTVLIPAMEKEGYGKAYSAALTAVTSVIGPIIPPSIAMIIYGVLSGTSIARLFIAGIVPGLMLGIGLMLYVYFMARRHGHPVSERVSLPQKIVATGRAAPALMLPVIILGGILSGVFSPTESAAVAVIYALLVSSLLYRTLRLSDLWRTLNDTAILTAGIMLIVAVAKMVSFVLGFDNVPARVATAMLEISHDKFVLLLLVNVFLLLLGLFLEPLAAMIMTMPVLLEVAKLLELDLVHLGMIVVLNLVIGLATPPVGLCLFIVCAIGRVSLEKVSRAALPMLGICLAVLLLVTFVPELVLFLPNLLDS
ncbi:MAG: TRAP transporter large permease [Rhodospirillaceae bacterium]